jgi:hypothetical protein
MWISTDKFLEIATARSFAEGESRALAEQNKALQVSIDWFRVRISQLEMERAQLLFNYTGVKVPVATIERAPDTESVAEKLNRVPSFEDLGDREAARLGVEWDSFGELKYAETK